MAIVQGTPTTQKEEAQKEESGSNLTYCLQHEINVRIEAFDHHPYYE